MIFRDELKSIKEQYNIQALFLYHYKISAIQLLTLLLSFFSIDKCNNTSAGNGNLLQAFPLSRKVQFLGPLKTRSFTTATAFRGSLMPMLLFFSKKSNKRLRVLKLMASTPRRLRCPTLTKEGHPLRVMESPIWVAGSNQFREGEGELLR